MCRGFGLAVVGDENLMRGGSREVGEGGVEGSIVSSFPLPPRPFEGLKVLTLVITVCPPLERTKSATLEGVAASSEFPPKKSQNPLHVSNLF